MGLFADALHGGIDRLAAQDYSHFFEQYKRIQKYYKTQYRAQKKPKRWNQTVQGAQHQKYKYNDSNKKTKDKADNDTDDADDAPKPKVKNFGKKWGKKQSNGPSAFSTKKKGK